ncbi:hypothetical protein BGZ94_000642, partial [Podila epigama]
MDHSGHSNLNQSESSSTTKAETLGSKRKRVPSPDLTTPPNTTSGDGNRGQQDPSDPSLTLDDANSQLSTQPLEQTSIARTSRVSSVQEPQPSKEQQQQQLQEDDEEKHTKPTKRKRVNFAPNAKDADHEHASTSATARIGNTRNPTTESNNEAEGKNVAELAVPMQIIEKRLATYRCDTLKTRSKSSRSSTSLVDTNELQAIIQALLSTDTVVRTEGYTSLLRYVSPGADTAADGTDAKSYVSIVVNIRDHLRILVACFIRDLHVSHPYTLTNAALKCLGYFLFNTDIASKIVGWEMQCIFETIHQLSRATEKK